MSSSLHSFRSYESTRSQNVSESRVTTIANEILRMRARGAEILGFMEGELDFPAAPEVIEATKAALEQGKTRYDDILGLRELRERVAQKLTEENGVAASPEELLVTNGSSQAIFEIFQAVLDPGDEVLVPTPGWQTYIEAIRLAGGVPKLYACTGDDVDTSLIEGLVGPHTKMLVVNTPHNPTGAVYSKRSLEALVDLAVAKDLLVLSDEAYEKILFDGAVHHSIAALAGRHRERILTTQTFSKSHAMTGFRVGYVHASSAIISRLAALHSHLTDNVCTFAQWGALRALEAGEGTLRERVTVLQARKERAVRRAAPLFEFAPPRGAFYLFPRISPLLGRRLGSATDFCDALLKEAGVAVLPGEAFGLEGHIRISFAGTPLTAIDAGFDRIATFVGSLRVS